MQGSYFKFYNGSPFVPGSYHRYVNDAGITVTTCQFNMQIPVQNMNTVKPLDLQLGYLALWNINPKNTTAGVLNNMHLTAPGYPAWQEGDAFWPQGSYPLFSDQYLQSLAPFCELRFMDWMNTNNNNATYSWANRPNANSTWDRWMEPIWILGRASLHLHGQ